MDHLLEKFSSVRLLTKTKSIHQNSSGNTLVMVTVFIVALFGFAALSVDIGNVLTHRARIQAASDSAALAAVVTWAKDKDVTLTQQVGTNFEATHGVQSNEVVSITTGRWDDTTHTFIPANSLSSGEMPAVEVIANRTIDLAFAPIVGLKQMSPRVRSIAIVGRATGSAGIVPWALCNNGLIPNKCSSVVLQGDVDCAGPGNFGSIALGGTGSDIYGNNITDGYQGTVYIGQTFDTEPGSMSGPTIKSVNERIAGLDPYTCTADSPPPDNKRMIVLPVVDSLIDAQGRSIVTIRDFWVFVLDGIDNKGNVSARFLESYSGTGVDPSAPPEDDKLNGVALVR